MLNINRSEIKKIFINRIKSPIHILIHLIIYGLLSYFFFQVIFDEFPNAESRGREITGGEIFLFALVAIGFMYTNLLWIIRIIVWIKSYALSDNFYKIALLSFLSFQLYEMFVNIYLPDESKNRIWNNFVSYVIGLIHLKGKKTLFKILASIAVFLAVLCIPGMILAYINYDAFMNISWSLVIFVFIMMFLVNSFFIWFIVYSIIRVKILNLYEYETEKEKGNKLVYTLMIITMRFNNLKKIYTDDEYLSDLDIALIKKVIRKNKLQLVGVYKEIFENDYKYVGEITEPIEFITSRDMKQKVTNNISKMFFNLWNLKSSYNTIEFETFGLKFNITFK
ncbi:hypothetical protein H9M94_03320 [Mycoplasma sp. Pen4]|uniref:hypothetical protein n=1 Tax=Mycoplasma sp. Pen4 TaxID=640330 RepID=UPI0016540E07|nr:hypothetical protein [Mycoplasma sp. Pen4]QNM93603.1 hypothetical protein H9M94_03320 [Mycoplasma sp. Pen4]